jgi:adenylate cyclase class IV
MQKIREKKKHRISYSLNGLEFDIDKYESIPTLLEIEAHTT